MTFAGEFLGLPGLRGYWPMGALDSSGNAIDQSGNVRTLTYTGNPTFNYTTEGGPYCDYDGTGDYHSRADEVGLDIIGTEAYVATAQRGLTMGGWFWGDAFSSATVMNLMGKLTNTSGTFAYWLIKSAANTIVGRVSSNGTTVTTVTSSVSFSNGAWYFIVERYTPSTELAIFAGDGGVIVKTINTTSIPASIVNSAEAFAIGGIGGTTPGAALDGRAGNCFVCAMILSDTAIDNIYQNTKAYYGL